MRKRANQESEIGVHKYEGFTMMQNHHLRNKGLSLKAVGLLSKILSLPPDWDYSLRGLATLNTDGIDGIRSAMKELEDHGYVVRTQRRDENGRMSKSRYEVYEIPQQRKPTSEKPSSENPTTVNPTTANPTTVSPITENPTQINTNQVITQETNYSGNNYQSINLDGIDRMDLRARYEEIIRENLELDILSQDRRFDIARVNEMVEIMLDAVCSTRPTICINGEELMSQDEIAVMDGGKCILQLRGVRPFLSDKFDITKHPKYKLLSDFDKRNAFDIEKYRSRRLVVKPTEKFDLYDMGEVEAG